VLHYCERLNKLEAETLEMRRLKLDLVTHTTAFLTRRLPVVSRTGRTEYQLLLMKASDRGRNVKFLGNNFGCVLSKLTNRFGNVL